MNKHILLLTCLLLSTQAMAQKAQLTVTDPAIDPSVLQKDFDVGYAGAPENSLPDAQARNHLLQEVKEVHAWDELERDIFYMDLKSKTVEELAQKYPKISAKKLKDLKARR